MTIGIIGWAMAVFGLAGLSALAAVGAEWHGMAERWAEIAQQWARLFQDASNDR